MATSRNLYTNQLSNRNFLSSVGFRFTLSRARKVSFLSNSANIPGLQLGVAEQPSYAPKPFNGISKLLRAASTLYSNNQMSQKHLNEVKSAIESNNERTINAFTNYLKQKHMDVYRRS